MGIFMITCVTLKNEKTVTCRADQFLFTAGYKEFVKLRNTSDSAHWELN